MKFSAINSNLKYKQSEIKYSDFGKARKLPPGWTSYSSGLPPVKAEQSDSTNLFEFKNINPEMLQC